MTIYEYSRLPPHEQRIALRIQETPELNPYIMRKWRDFKKQYADYRSDLQRRYQRPELSNP